MRILIATASSGSRGGGELYVIILAQALSLYGHTLIFWMSDAPAMDELAKAVGAFGEVVRSKYTNTYQRRFRNLGAICDRKAIRRIASEWTLLAPDIIQINKQNTEDGLDLILAAVRTGMPTACTIHITQSESSLGARFGWLRDFISVHLLRGKNIRYISVADARVAELSRFVDGPVLNVFTGAKLFSDEERLELRIRKRKELEIGNETKLFLGIARLVEQKRPMLFLRYAKRIHQIDPNARFCWVGSGAMDSEFNEAIRKEEMSGYVRHIGWEKDVSAYYCAGDVLLHTAGFEGLPLVVIGAMGASLLCVLTVELARQLPFESNKEILVIDDQDKWLALLRDRFERVRVISSARERVKSEFSMESMGFRYNELYLEMKRTEGK